MSDDDDKEARDLRSQLHLLRLDSGVERELEIQKKWRFFYDNHGNRSCQLQSMRCKYILPSSGDRCKRKTTLTLPYCWQHLRRVANIRIGRTSLTDEAGQRYKFLGLFACDPSLEDNELVFDKDDNIIIYFGEIMDKKDLDQIYPGDSLAPYAFKMNEDLWIDAACIRGVAALANTASIVNPDADENNASIKIIHPDLYPVIQAEKPILNGEEIFTDYGENFGGDPTTRTTPVREYVVKNYKC